MLTRNEVNKELQRLKSIYLTHAGLDGAIIDFVMRLQAEISKGDATEDIFIKNLAAEMIAQDNLATAHPLYCVFDKERILGIDSSYIDQYVWLHHDSLDSPLDESEIEFDDEGNPTNDSIEKYYYVDRDRFINAHFTMAAAKKWIETNKHNHPTAFVFVTSLYRCHEMIQLQEWIKKQAK